MQIFSQPLKPETLGLMSDITANFRKERAARVSMGMSEEHDPSMSSLRLVTALAANEAPDSAFRNTAPGIMINTMQLVLRTYAGKRVDDEIHATISHMLTDEVIDLETIEDAVADMEQACARDGIPLQRATPANRRKGSGARRRGK